MIAWFVSHITHEIEQTCHEFRLIDHVMRNLIVIVIKSNKVWYISISDNPTKEMFSNLIIRGNFGAANVDWYSLQWYHNGCDGVSNHKPLDCLLSRLFRRRSKKTSKFRVTGLCAGNSPVTGEFPTQIASNAENVSIWWCHHTSGQYHCVSNTTHTIIYVFICIFILCPSCSFLLQAYDYKHISFSVGSMALGNPMIIRKIAPQLCGLIPALDMSNADCWISHNVGGYVIFTRGTGFKNCN